MEIRKIQKEDDPFMATIIRQTLEEFDANKPGTVYYDASIYHLSTLFEKKKANIL